MGYTSRKNMKLSKLQYLSVAIALASGCFAAAAAASPLVQYELTGKLGTETSDAATTVAAGLTGMNLNAGAGLTPSAGLNAMSASGWNNLSPNDFFSLGFTVQPGFTATVDELSAAVRSSATGPGFMNLLYSLNGGPETLLATLTMPNALFLDEDLHFSTLTVTSSIRFLFRAANTTAANGGTIGSAGTLRISDYSPDGGSTFEPVTLNGSVTAVATAVPEPATGLLGVLGIALAGCLLRTTNAQNEDRVRI